MKKVLALLVAVVAFFGCSKEDQYVMYRFSGDAEFYNVTYTGNSGVVRLDSVPDTAWYAPAVLTTGDDYVFTVEALGDNFTTMNASVHVDSKGVNYSAVSAPNNSISLSGEIELHKDSWKLY